MACSGGLGAGSEGIDDGGGLYVVHYVWVPVVGCLEGGGRWADRPEAVTGGIISMPDLELKNDPYVRVDSLSVSECDIGEP